MYLNKNFVFKITISKENYESKADAIACLSKPGSQAIGRNKMAWVECEVSIDDFMRLATSGYCFCNLFDVNPFEKYWIENKEGKWREVYPTYRNGANKGYMKMQFKADQFFRGSQTIFVDVDYTRFEDVQDYLRVLNIPPTCVYMSFSDKKEKGKAKIWSRRFRMVYLFSEILNAVEFETIARVITEQIEKDTGEAMDDDCGTRKSQYMNGVYGNDETYRSDYIYSKHDFFEGGILYVPPREEDEVLPDEVVESSDEFDRNLVNDMERLSYDEFMHYYSQKYEYFYRVERDEWINNLYQFTDEGFLRLYYYRETVRDGDWRRRKLFYAACLRRLMRPNVDANTLLFNLYVDRERFYDNSDGVISVTHLRRKVLTVLKMSIEELEIFCGKSIAYWKNNRPQIIFKRGTGIISLRLAREIYTELRYREIDEQYDPTMSLKENIEAGLDVPASTLYRYCRVRNYDTDPNRPPSIRKQQEQKRKEKQKAIETFQKMYNPRWTTNENIEYMAANGLVLRYRTFMRWKEKYIVSQPQWGYEPIETPKMNELFDVSNQVPPVHKETTPPDEFEENNWSNFWSDPFANLTIDLSRYKFPG